MNDIQMSNYTIFNR